MSPIERQNEAQRLIGYGPIHLRKEGDYVFIAVSYGGLWIDVIREHADSNFSHIVEPVGIEKAISKSQGVDLDSYFRK